MASIFVFPLVSLALQAHAVHKDSLRAHQVSNLMHTRVLQFKVIWRHFYNSPSRLTCMPMSSSVKRARVRLRGWLVLARCPWWIHAERRALFVVCWSCGLVHSRRSAFFFYFCSVRKPLKMRRKRSFFSIPSGTFPQFFSVRLETF